MVKIPEGYVPLDKSVELKEGDEILYVRDPWHTGDLSRIRYGYVTHNSAEAMISKLHGENRVWARFSDYPWNHIPTGAGTHISRKTHKIYIKAKTKPYSPEQNGDTDEDI